MTKGYLIWKQGCLLQPCFFFGHVLSRGRIFLGPFGMKWDQCFNLSVGTYLLWQKMLELYWEDLLNAREGRS